jgi:hypothetical protein
MIVGGRGYGISQPGGISQRGNGTTDQRLSLSSFLGR